MRRKTIPRYDENGLKICTKCLGAKPLSEYYKSSDGPDGRMARCKQCQNVLTREWQEKNRERARELSRESGIRNRERRNIQSRGYYRKNAEQMKLSERLRQQALKHKAYEAYGGFSCACCGESEPMFLCLDHVDGGGNEHRREIGGARSIYMWLFKNNYPAGFMQVLCFNCNQGKRLNNNICPHVTRASEGGNESGKGNYHSLQV